MLVLRARQKGASLTELMISMSLGFASLTAMSSLVGHGIGLNASLMAKSRLDEEVNAVAALIIRDIKRSGYQHLTPVMLDDPSKFNRPFANSVQLSAYGTESKDSCITFSYDRNQNGQLDLEEINEKYGYRLRDKSIEIRMDGLGCEEGRWQDLTDLKVVIITHLSFKLSSSGAANSQQVEMLLQAKLRRYPELSKQVNTSFGLSNL